MEKNVKNDFSIIGFSYLSMGLISIFAQIIIAMIFATINPKIIANINYTTILTSFCQYIIPIPVLLYLLSKLKKTKLSKHKISLNKFLIYICITFTLMYIGNIIGLGITEIIGLIKQNSVINPIVDLIQTSNISINLIIISLIAPIFEEFFFRKLLIDRTIQYGAKISIFLSALMFGLFHGNLNQFFYAFLIGGFFAIVYIKTGNIIYPIILHMITNLFGSVVSITVQNLINTLGNTSLGTIVTLIYLIIIFLIFLIGLIYIFQWKDKLSEFKNKIEHPIKTSLLNIGMICFIIYCLIEIVYVILI